MKCTRQRCQLAPPSTSGSPHIGVLSGRQARLPASVAGGKYTRHLRVGGRPFLLPTVNHGY